MHTSYSDMQKKILQWKLDGKLVATVDCAGIRLIQVGSNQREALEKVKESIEVFLSTINT